MSNRRPVVSLHHKTGNRELADVIGCVFISDIQALRTVARTVFHADLPLNACIPSYATHCEALHLELELASPCVLWESDILHT